MKLYVTPTSPYVRVVRMAIEELRLGAQVEVITAKTRVPECEVNALVPTGKVPMLETDDGHCFAESRLICQYLDALHTDDPVVDHDPLEADRAFEGVTTGFLDGISVWVRELRRPENERSPSIIEQERARAQRCVTWFEAHMEAVGDRVDYPRLCLVAALFTLDERIDGGIAEPGQTPEQVPEQVTGWKEAAPALAQWYATFSERPSFKATRPA